ncbi:MAG: hypothetical protein FWF57_00885 [Defluviitaleaceae bacterium]|nr:hypothetical protein [Defluviitaleaceae bacterium]
MKYINFILFLCGAVLGTLIVNLLSNRFNNNLFNNNITIIAVIIIPLSIIIYKGLKTKTVFIHISRYLIGILGAFIPLYFMRTGNWILPLIILPVGIFLQRYINKTRSFQNNAL